MTNTNHKNPMKSTRARSSSRGVQRGLSEMPDVAMQPHRGPRSQGGDHRNKSQCAGTEKREGETYLPSRSDSTGKGTHHAVKHPDLAGIRVRARGPSHLHPTWGNNLNPATTHSYVEAVRGAAPRSGQPSTATSPPHNTRHNPYPCALWVRKGTQHAQQWRTREGRRFVLRSPKEGLSTGILRRKVVTCSPSGEQLRKWTSWGPLATVGERYLTAGLGWLLGRILPTVKALSLCGLDTEK